MTKTRGERFQDARKALLDSSINAVSKATGVTSSMISDLENDDIERDVGYSKIAALARHYKESTDYLLCLSDYPKYKDRSVTAETIGLSNNAMLQLLGFTAIKLKGVDGKPIKYIDIVNELLENEAFKDLIAQIVLVKTAKQAQERERKEWKQEYELFLEEDRPKIPDTDSRDVRFAKWAAVEDFSRIVDDITSL